MKKVFVLSLALLVVFSFAFVAAAGANSLGDGLGQGMEGLVDAVEQMLYPLLSVVLGDSGENLFEKVLFGVLLVALVYVVISRIPVFEDRTYIVWIITISVALLSTRFLTENELVQFILLPYGVFGVALTSILPLVIYFWFVEYGFPDSATLRKMLWIFYTVVFIGLWASRYNDLGNLAWIYAMSAIAGFLFFFFDGTLRKKIVVSEMEKKDFVNKSRMLARLDAELDKFEKDEAPKMDSKTANEARKAFAQQRKYIVKLMNE